VCKSAGAGMQGWIQVHVNGWWCCCRLNYGNDYISIVDATKVVW